MNYQNPEKLLHSVFSTEMMLDDNHNPDVRSPLSPDEMQLCSQTSKGPRPHGQAKLDTLSFETLVDGSASASSVTFLKRKEYSLHRPPPGDNQISGLNAMRNPSESTFFRRRPELKMSNVRSSTYPSGSLRSPDRFLPKHTALNSAVQSFRANTDPKNLSDAERLLRNEKDTADAILGTRRRVTPTTVNPSFGFPFAGNRPVLRGGYRERPGSEKDKTNHF
jgi:hypothetical protein